MCFMPINAGSSTRCDAISRRSALRFSTRTREMRTELRARRAHASTSLVPQSAFDPRVLLAPPTSSSNNCLGHSQLPSQNATPIDCCEFACTGSSENLRRSKSQSDRRSPFSTSGRRLQPPHRVLQPNTSSRRAPRRRHPMSHTGDRIICRRDNI
jgi:hypothetical protein